MTEYANHATVANVNNGLLPSLWKEIGSDEFQKLLAYFQSNKECIILQ